MGSRRSSVVFGRGRKLKRDALRRLDRRFWAVFMIVSWIMAGLAILTLRYVPLDAHARKDPAPPAARQPDRNP